MGTGAPPAEPQDQYRRRTHAHAVAAGAPGTGFQHHVYSRPRTGQSQAVTAGGTPAQPCTFRLRRTRRTAQKSQPPTARTQPRTHGTQFHHPQRRHEVAHVLLFPTRPAVHDAGLSRRRRRDEIPPVPQRRERAARPETGVGLAWRANCRRVPGPAGGKLPRRVAQEPRFHDRGGFSVTMTAKPPRSPGRRLGGPSAWPLSARTEQPAGSSRGCPCGDARRGVKVAWVRPGWAGSLPRGGWDRWWAGRRFG